MPDLTAAPLRSARLALEPLRVDHAPEAAAAFDDVALHTFTGGSPAGPEELRRRYERQVVGRSPDGARTWLNWMLRHRRTGEVLGTVQATVAALDGEGSAQVAEVAWVVATPHQRQGYAQEAAAVMATWLGEQDVVRIDAHVHPDHAASAAVARAIGLTRTSEVVDGEERWSGRPPGRRD